MKIFSSIACLCFLAFAVKAQTPGAANNQFSAYAIVIRPAKITIVPAPEIQNEDVANATIVNRQVITELAAAPVLAAGSAPANADKSAIQAGKITLQPAPETQSAIGQQVDLKIDTPSKIPH